MRVQVHLSEKRFPALFLAYRSGSKELVELEEFAGVQEWQRAVALVRSPAVAVLSSSQLTAAEIARVLALTPLAARRYVRFLVIAESARDSIEVDARCGNRIADIILSKEEAVMCLVAGHVNDTGASAGCADTLRYLSGRWGTTADTMLKMCAGSGFRLATVAAISGACGVNRKTLSRHASENGLTSPSRILIAAKAMCCALEVWRSHRGMRAIARAIGAKDSRTLTSLMQRTVHISRAELSSWRQLHAETECCNRLVSLLDAYVLGGHHSALANARVHSRV